MRRHRKQHIHGCRTSSRHWFTVHGAPTATCRHACGAIHPDILKALQRGLLYAKLYSPPEDADFDKAVRELERDKELIRLAIERVGNERQV